MPLTKNQSDMMPSVLVFGPLARLLPEQLAELRSELKTSQRLSKLHATVRDLPNLWYRLILFDPDLMQIPGQSYLHDFVEWLAEGRRFPFRASQVPTTLAIPINFLLQITQYLRFTQSLPTENAHGLLLRVLEHGGVQGFCVGLLGAITVSASSSEEELVETAACALRLAFCIGVYVEKDAAVVKTRCISVRRSQKQDKWDQALNVLRDFPQVIPTLVTS